MSTRLAAAVSLTLGYAGCCFGLPQEEEAPASPSPVAAEREDVAGPPELDPTPTGRHNGDHALTLDRCVRTSWSFHGCDSAYPNQGRQWLTYECESASGAPANIGSALGGDELDTPALERELSELRGHRSAPPPTDAERYRRVVCARLADYRIRGTGGPIEREAGLATLDGLCTRGDRTACARLAQDRVWAGEVELARPAFERACQVDPANSPAGLCATLRDVFTGGLHRFEITLTEARGAEMSTDTLCVAFVIRRTAPPQGPWLRDAHHCEGRVQCGPRILYGNGGSVCPCSFEGGRLRAGETMTTGEDGDPAFTVDTAGQGTFVLRDDESGNAGAFTLRGTLRSVTP